MADLMSKQLDLDDYMLDPNLLAIADIQRGPTPGIDLALLKLDKYLDFVVIGLILLWKY